MESWIITKGPVEGRDSSHVQGPPTTQGATRVIAVTNKRDEYDEELLDELAQIIFYTLNPAMYGHRWSFLPEADRGQYIAAARESLTRLWIKARDGGNLLPRERFNG